MAVSCSVSFHIHDNENIDARCERHTASSTGGYIAIEIGNAQCVIHGPIADLVKVGEVIAHATQKFMPQESEVPNA